MKLESRFLEKISVTSDIGEGDGTPLQYYWLENPMYRGAWKAAVHEVAKSRAGQSDFTFTFHFHALENPRDRGASWAAVYGVAQSWARLTWLSSNLRYAHDTILIAESEEELKSLLMKESEKVDVKLNIQKTKIMASGPITSWH